MLEPLFSALFPVRPSPAVRRAWLVAILLFPLALIAGFLVLEKNTPPPPVHANTDANRAISIARAFLISQGIPARSWTAIAKANTNTDILAFANAKAARIGVWSLAPPIFATVTFHASDQDAATVSISVDGRVLGFNWKQTPPPSPVPSDAEALRLALTRVPPDSGFGQPSVERTGEKRVYTFRSSKIPEAELTETVTVVGNRLISYSTTADASDSVGTPTAERVQTLLTILGSLFVCVVAIFSIYRYAARTLQQEISHRRSLIVALLCACFCVFIGFNAVVNNSTGGVPLSVILLVFAVMGVLGGALLAAAYGSGEGDIREAFPGKLTSLDAFLSGRVFSRNIGVSTFFGMACSGWLVLALALLSAPFASREPIGSPALSSLFVQFAWIMPFVIYPLMALSFAAAGLLQPLAFLHRFVTRRRWLHLPFLLLSAGLVSTLRTHSPATGEFLIASAILVASLLLPFFLLDLLAALACFTTVVTVMGLAVSVVLIPAEADSSLRLHLAGFLAVVLFSVWCILRGRLYSEEQVRPLYARHIVERKSLEAEVSAAREAQLRLLPDSLPDFAGLDISAACVPAETVGGDFYDFFPLGDGRLGIFIAEGNNRGLAAALTIALAKGYLMQCVERFREPVEILTRLEAVLASIFPPDALSDRSALTDFAFASIDTNAGQIRYARTGVYPKVVVVSGNAVVASERLVPVRGRVSPLSEGLAVLSPGDHAVLFTDGIGRRLAFGNRRPEEAAASLVSRSSAAESMSPGAADRIRERIFASSNGSTEPDDLTLVVIRMQALAEFENAGALQGVA